MKATLIDRLVLAFKPGAVARLVAAVQAQYESGQRWSSRRSWLPGYVRDARLDADSMTRLEIVRKARYFERNSGIVNRLADLFEEYTVGPEGLRFVPSSSDQEWNTRAAEWWEGWCSMCDVTSQFNFGTIQSLAARSQFIDGELFVLLTNGREREGGRSYPRIQLVESHRVETPPSLFTTAAIVDGVQVDKRGRPIAYHVREGGEQEETFATYEASKVVHLFEPSRPGMYRGLPMLYPVLNDLHDLDDLQLLEMDAAKEAAAITNVIKTKTGELSDQDLRRARLLGSGTKGTSGGSDSARSQYYNDVFKGRAKVLKHGDDITQFASTRPSVAQQQYWDYLTSKICAGVGISKLLVFPWSIQGTVVRADLDVASTFFRSRSSVMASKWTQVYTWVMDWGTKNVQELSDPPEDFRKVTVRPPRSVNVDVGRNAAALIAEYEAGWRTLEDVCGELGKDWRQVLRQRAVERKKARELEAEFGLTEGELIGAALEAIATKQKNQGLEAAPQQQAA